MYITIVCFPGCGAINFWINLIFLIQPFLYMTEKARQKFKYLRMKRGFFLAKVNHKKSNLNTGQFHLVEQKDPNRELSSSNSSKNIEVFSKAFAKFTWSLFSNKVTTYSRIDLWTAASENSCPENVRDFPSLSYKHDC